MGGEIKVEDALQPRLQGSRGDVFLVFGEKSIHRPDGRPNSAGFLPAGGNLNQSPLHVVKKLLSQRSGNPRGSRSQSRRLRCQKSLFVVSQSQGRAVMIRFAYSIMNKEKHRSGNRIFQYQLFQRNARGLFLHAPVDGLGAEFEVAQLRIEFGTRHRQSRRHGMLRW